MKGAATGRAGAQGLPAPVGELLSGRQRLDQVRQYVLANQSASPAELARRFGVSVMTVHRDLAELEQQGVVRRFRGGVTAQPSAVFESNIAYRMNAMQAEKDAIALSRAPLYRAGHGDTARRLDDLPRLARVTWKVSHR